MACEFSNNAVQTVNPGESVVFTASPVPCNRGLVRHRNDSGNFLLRGNVRRNACGCCAESAQYLVDFGANIAIPTGGTVGSIAVAITINGEPRLTSRAIFTPAAVEEYGNVTSTAIIKVPRGCCFSLSVESVPATTDATVTPAPIIDVQNANFVINRIA